MAIGWTTARKDIYTTMVFPAASAEWADGERWQPYYAKVDISLLPVAFTQFPRASPGPAPNLDQQMGKKVLFKIWASGGGADYLKNELSQL